MNPKAFDHWLRTLRRTRRAAFTMLLAGAGGLAGFTDLDARKSRRHKRKRKQVITNAFGCVDVGKFCREGAQCCSGICSGKKGKRTCKAHDQTTCPPGLPQDVCFGDITTCSTSAGWPGLCITSTGKGSYCARTGKGECMDCTKDADCIPLYGPRAACVVCGPDCSAQTLTGTFCAVIA